MERMEMIEGLVGGLGLADVGAALLFVAAILGLTAAIERSEAPRLSVGWLMARHRRDWMAQMAEREIRIMDTALLAIQHQGSAFFASAMMIAIGGVVALIGATEQLVLVASHLTDAPTLADRALWELKLLFLLGLLALAFLKFVWSYRLFGYCAILIGATPPCEDPGRAAISARAAEINIRAGRAFNRGLRLVYFALAALAWLLGPLAFALATLATVGMLYRREFRSETHRILDGAP